MSAQRRHNQTCNDQGWNQEAQIALMGEFIRDKGLFEEFSDYAAKAAKEENESTGESDMSPNDRSGCERKMLKSMESNERYVVVRLCIANHIQYLGRVSSLKEFEIYRDSCGFEKSDIAVQDWKPAG